jgi:hypothetical protein
MICGGRYLSCDDAIRVFAAGSETNQMSLEVKWRSGKFSVVHNVRANREYEIEEAGATNPRSENSEGQRGKSGAIPAGGSALHRLEIRSQGGT